MNFRLTGSAGVPHRWLALFIARFSRWSHKRTGFRSYIIDNHNLNLMIALAAGIGAFHSGTATVNILTACLPVQKHYFCQDSLFSLPTIATRLAILAFTGAVLLIITAHGSTSKRAHSRSRT